MLQALELSGFKSFADRTKFEIPAGVTVVVGPNGSGKSNVVDAIKWVLGSQSPKSLRGAEMIDVIFSGSGSRKPLNAAEVTLGFSNKTKLFPLDTPEVRITRRVYRSGEGEYLINGQSCRLRDIKELLAGTGIGGDGYSIIEQGRVDALLQSTPQHRRTIFEEAAGISRYRLKKQEAAKRLERVDQNLLRLSDIVEEVDGRLRRVRSQAGKAQRYHEQTQRLRELRGQLGLADWRALTQQIGQCETERAKFAEHEAARTSELAEREAHLAAQQESFELSATRVSELGQRLAEVREALAGGKARQEAIETRIAELRTEQQRLEAMCREMAQSDGDAAETDPAAASAEESARSAFEVAQFLLEEQLEQLTDLQSAEAVARRRRDDAQAKRQAADRELGEQSGWRDRLNTEIVDLERRATQLSTRLASAEERQRQSISQAAAAQSQERQLAVRGEKLSAELSTAQQRLEQARREVTQTHKQLATIETELVELTHRAAALDELEQRLETLGADMRQLVETTTNDSPPELLGLVADLLHVDADAAPLVEAALGDAAHQVVVAEGSDLVAALTDSPTAFTARASFQRLDHALPTIALDRIDLSTEPGVIGRADHFVECDERHAPLVKRLLGRTWFVDNLPTAWLLSQSLGRGLSFVTLAAEVLSAEGAIIAGPKEDLAGLFSRREESERLRQKLIEGQRQADQLRVRIEELEQSSAVLLQEIAQKAADQTRAAEELAQLRQQIAALAERTTHTERETEQLQHDLAEVTTAAENRRHEFADREIRYVTSTDRAARLAAELTASSQQHQAAQQALSALTMAMTESRVQLVKAEQEWRLLTLRNDAQERAQAAELARVRAEESMAECGVKLFELTKTQAEVERELMELAERRAGLEEELNSAQASDAASRAAWTELSSALAVLRAEVDSMRMRGQHVELRQHQANLERQTLAERLQQEVELDIASLAAATAPEEVLVDRAAVESEIEQLRQDLHSIGPVNSEALAELTELEERFTELSVQYKDLSEAKEALERLTQRINTDSRDVFTATVEEVRGHFRDLYRRLFGGGEADIVLLEDPSGDVLECGVEIAACPPGKELKSLSLLSGGEKTLTCVALLLALFRSKPSPFCILDEVDAALDEANIGRFTGVLSEFLSSTQFIVITHSKKTMTGAHTLYGVTMQESGVSKQVAVKFEDVSDNGDINPRAMLQAPAELRRAA